MIYDTLKLSRSLHEKAGFSTPQAEGIAEALNEAAQGNLATKSDLSELKSELPKWIVGVVTVQTLAIITAVAAIIHRG
jgi:hypothetical protein